MQTQNVWCSQRCDLGDLVDFFFFLLATLLDLTHRVMTADASVVISIRADAPRKVGVSAATSRWWTTACAPGTRWGRAATAGSTATATSGAAAGWRQWPARDAILGNH